jgi:hypothetical protein
MTTRRSASTLARVGAALVAVLLVWLAPGGVARAQEAPTASAEAVCLGDRGISSTGEGAVSVAILDESGTPTYDVAIAGVVVGEAVPASGGDAYLYRPYDDGTHRVAVVWLDDSERTGILDTTVTVDCEASAAVPPTPEPSPAPAPIRMTG